MSRINDILFISSGGHPFSLIFAISDDFDVKPYYDRKANLNYKRNLWADSRGVDSDVDANIDAVMNDINRFTNNRMDTIGQVCLLGRSAGCALTLGLAAELNARGVNDLTFVGVSDVPMWDLGRPPVRRVGKFQPINNPASSGAEAPSKLRRGPFAKVNPAGLEIPFVNLDTEIKVASGKNKINHLQIQGNHMKYSWSAKRWMWWSDISEGEVHGELNGFQNKLFKVSGVFDGIETNSDLEFHVELNLGEHWKALCSQAAAAFADLPAQPLA